MLYRHLNVGLKSDRKLDLKSDRDLTWKVGLKITVLAQCLLVTINLQAERGVNVDINGFIEASTRTITSFANGIAGAAVALTCIGLMIPGFREVTRRALPWTLVGVVGIIIVTKYWR